MELLVQVQEDFILLVVVVEDLHNPQGHPVDRAAVEMLVPLTQAEVLDSTTQVVEVVGHLLEQFR
jgi:hypothetical protein